MRESAITRLGDRTLSFFYYRKLQFFLKLCNFFNVPLYIQVTGSVENKGGKCFYENNFKANDCFFSFSCNDNFCSMFYGGRSRDTSNLYNLRSFLREYFYQ